MKLFPTPKPTPTLVYKEDYAKLHKNYRPAEPAQPKPYPWKPTINPPASKVNAKKSTTGAPIWTGKMGNPLKKK